MVIKCRAKNVAHVTLYLTDCLSKNIDNIILHASLFIFIYLFPFLLGLLLKVKHNNIQVKCLPLIPINITQPTFHITFKYVLNLLHYHFAAFPGQKLYLNHRRLKSLILIVFPLLPLIARVYSFSPFFCSYSNVFVNNLFCKEKLCQTL